MSVKTVRRSSSEECGSTDTCDMTRKIKLKFSLSLLSEEDLETGGCAQEDWEDMDFQNDCFIDDDVPLVSLDSMRINLVVDQDLDTVDSFCGFDQQFNEIMILAEEANVANMAFSNLFLKSRRECKYVGSAGQSQLCLEDTMSAKITVFQVITRIKESSGVPVVLNFTGTNNYICATNGEEKILTFKACDKAQLHNSADAPGLSSLVFYKSQTADGILYFESALHRGWFIHTFAGTRLKLQRGRDSSSCFDLIRC